MKAIKKFLQTTLSFLFAAAMLISIAACGSAGGETDRDVVRDPNDTNDYKMMQMTDLSVGLVYSSDNYPSNVGGGDNALYDLHESAMNIRLRNEIELPWDGYENMITSRIITGKLPDVFLATEKMVNELIKNGRILNMRKYYDLYAAEELKECLECYDGMNMKFAESGDKLWALPAIRDAADQPVVWSRLDWIQTLNARGTEGKKVFDTVNNRRFHEEGPQSLDEFWALAEAFALEDPDGNGIKDTYGLSISSDTDITVSGIFNAYGAYPNTLTRLEDGSYVNRGLDDEMTEAMDKLREMVAKKVISPDAVNYDMSAARAKVGTGNWGMIVGEFYYPLLELSYVTNYDDLSKGNWVASPMYAKDGNIVVPARNKNNSGYYVVSTTCQNPEAVIKLLNNFASRDPENEFFQGYSELQAQYEKINNWAPVIIDRLDSNVKRYESFVKAIEAKETTGSYDESVIAADDKSRWEGIKLYLSGIVTRESWMWYNIYFSGVKTVIEYRDKDGNETGVRSDWVYAETDAMGMYLSRLEKMANETRTKYIFSESPTDLEKFWDNYVKDWKASGGDKILESMKNAER